MTRLLLDTHVFLWWLADSDRLSGSARDRIADPQAEVFVSAASIWEIAIKRALGKLKAPRRIVPLVEEEGFHGAAMELIHAERAGVLPPHHRDPFDRMLIAQAQIEDLTIVSADGRFEQYELKLVRV
jgi:PIN domain nuclease of toxin-antitoxin system